MKDVLNKTRRPIKVPLPGGKVLHLGPAKSGQVADGAVDSPAFQKLLREGVIELVAGGAHGSTSPEEAAPGHESTHGHRQPKVVLPKGNR